MITDDPAHVGCHVARAHTADHHGGAWLPGVLVSTTLAELMAMMPPKLVGEDRTAFDPPGVVETW